MKSDIRGEGLSIYTAKAKFAVVTQERELLTVVHLRVRVVGQFGQIREFDPAVPRAAHLRGTVTLAEVRFEAKAADAAGRGSWAGHERHHAVRRVWISVPIRNPGMPLMRAVL